MTDYPLSDLVRLPGTLSDGIKPGAAQIHQDWTFAHTPQETLFGRMADLPAIVCAACHGPAQYGPPTWIGRREIPLTVTQHDHYSHRNGTALCTFGTVRGVVTTDAILP